MGEHRRRLPGARAEPVLPMLRLEKSVARLHIALCRAGGFGEP